MLSKPKTILLTGGTEGIGFALFKQLHSQGHTLIVVARNQQRLSSLQSTYDRVSTYKCDLSSRLELESLCNKISLNHLDLSIIINNAGIQYTPKFLDNDFSFDAIEHETRVNFLAPVWLSSLLLPTLIEHKNPGAIINISSALIFAPKTNSAIYCATKAAIHSFSQSLRYQLEQTHVQVIEAIMPLVDTAMTAGRRDGKISPESAAQQIINGINQRRSEIYVGKARLLPTLMRVSPSLVKRIMRRY
ncbi:MAG: SDR family NAD(P)-dependent oxidoreductase [Thiotrichaceae bacterium]|nr:SDR family NAD(P)-dependent oxidoreductase [Thiotrichaceae bacterium]PCI12097.1 MAG: hypothetical protein COB71_10690 [Thiotrichales bacterium]